MQITDFVNNSLVLIFQKKHLKKNTDFYSKCKDLILAITAVSMTTVLYSPTICLSFISCLELKKAINLAITMIFMSGLSVKSMYHDSYNIEFLEDK